PRLARIRPSLTSLDREGRDATGRRESGKDYSCVHGGEPAKDAFPPPRLPVALTLGRGLRAAEAVDAGGLRGGDALAGGGHDDVRVEHALDALAEVARVERLAL